MSRPHVVDKVPVTIVTGSLGAGKTTLLKHILREKHGFRIAVIENEFAESGGIESLILKDDIGGKVADGFYELSNGCLCCSVRDSLVETLMAVMKVKEKFDYILVETSGLADPGAVASIFWTDLDDDATLDLDGIVTLIDAVNFEKSLNVDRHGGLNEVHRQVAYADVILVNKMDLAGTDQVHSVRTLIDSINPLATKLQCTRSVIPLERILNIRALHRSHEIAEIPESSCGASCSHDHHHDSHVSYITLAAKGSISRDKLTTMLGCMLWEKQVVDKDGGTTPLLGNIFRVKGVVWCADEDGSGESVPHLVQAVHQLFDIVPLQHREAAGDEENKLVVIGMDLREDERLLQQQFADCCVGGT